MADRFVIKENDTRKVLERQLLNDDGSPIDLTGATVRFHMRAIGSTGTPKVDAAASILGDPTQGNVRYSWQAADVNAAGRYEGEFEVTFPDTTVITVPNERYISITVVDDIA